jgi:hypothetical protein
MKNYRSHIRTSRIVPNYRIDVAFLSKKSWEKACRKYVDNKYEVSECDALTILGRNGEDHSAIYFYPPKMTRSDVLGLAGLCAHEAFHAMENILGSLSAEDIAGVDSEQIAYTIGDITEKLMTKFRWYYDREGFDLGIPFS